MEFWEGTSSVFARCVSAHVRAQLGAQRMSGNTLATRIGKSQNYVATRLRDELPFTLDDIEEIVAVLEPKMQAHTFIRTAQAVYTESISGQARGEARAYARHLWDKNDDDWTEQDESFVIVYKEIWNDLIASKAQEAEADAEVVPLHPGKEDVSDGSDTMQRKAALSRDVQTEHEHLDN